MTEDIFISMPERVTRESAAADRSTLYIFTDNTDRTSGRTAIPADSRYAQRFGQGLFYPGTTLAVLRGLDNAMPVSTQRWYHDGAKGVTGRWNDEDFDEFKKVIDDEFDAVLEEWNTGRYERIAMPQLTDGNISAITRGRTPRLYAYLQEKKAALKKSVEMTERKGSFASLHDFIRTASFKERFGDWQHGEGRMPLGKDGEPLVLWHGSARAFDAFDLSHAGDNTGITEYTDPDTGEKILSDSDKTVFFTDNRELAVSYAFLARTQDLGRISGLLTDLISLLYDPQKPIVSHIKTINDLRRGVSSLRSENDRDLQEALDMLQVDKDNPITRLPEDERLALRQRFIDIRKRYNEAYRLNDHGGISNMLNNLVRQKDYLQYFEANLPRLCAGDKSVLNEFGDFTTYDQTFFGPHNNSIHVFSGDGQLRVSGFRKESVALSSLNGQDRQKLIDAIRGNLDTVIEQYNSTAKAAGYLDAVHLYPVFLETGKTLSHDYKGSAFPDKYIPNPKYPTAYVAARQVRKALADGYDSVSYENIMDPFLGTTYGVFDTERIMMLDPERFGIDASARLSTTAEDMKNGTSLPLDKNPYILKEGRSADINSYTDNPYRGLSNFTAYPFTVRGVRVASMEGFLQGLKFSSVQQQNEVFRLSGFVAKQTGYKVWHDGDPLYFQGRPVERNSQEYQTLLDEAYESLYLSNQGFRSALEATKGRTLKHSIGKDSPSETILTISEFLSRLNGLRDKGYLKKRILKGLDWDRHAAYGYEVSSAGDSRFSAFNATFLQGTMLGAHDISGMSIEQVYQSIIKRSSKGNPPSQGTIVFNEDDSLSKEALEDFSFMRGYLPLWSLWAEQHWDLIVDLKRRAAGRALTDRFAHTSVSQARALAHILKGDLRQFAEEDVKKYFTEGKDNTYKYNTMDEYINNDKKGEHTYNNIKESLYGYGDNEIVFSDEYRGLEYHVSRGDDMTDVPSVHIVIPGGHPLKNLFLDGINSVISPYGEVRAVSQSPAFGEKNVLYWDYFRFDGKDYSAYSDDEHDYSKGKKWTLQEIVSDCRTQIDKIQEYAGLHMNDTRVPGAFELDALNSALLSYGLTMDRKDDDVLDRKVIPGSMQFSSADRSGLTFNYEKSYPWGESYTIHAFYAPLVSLLEISEHKEGNERSGRFLIDRHTAVPAQELIQQLSSEVNDTRSLTAEENKNNHQNIIDMKEEQDNNLQSEVLTRELVAQMEEERSVTQQESVSAPETIATENSASLQETAVPRAKRPRIRRETVKAEEQVGDMAPKESAPSQETAAIGHPYIIPLKDIINLAKEECLTPSGKVTEEDIAYTFFNSGIYDKEPARIERCRDLVIEALDGDADAIMRATALFSLAEDRENMKSRLFDAIIRDNGMTLSTGHYNAIPVYRAEGHAHIVSISRSEPKDVTVDGKVLELAPSRALHVRRHTLTLDGNPSVSDEQYTQEYNEGINKLGNEGVSGALIPQLMKAIETGRKEVILTCWEKEGEFCHRHLLSAFINDNIHDSLVKEWTVKQELDPAAEMASEIIREHGLTRPLSVDAVLEISDLDPFIKLRIEGMNEEERQALAAALYRPFAKNILGDIPTNTLIERTAADTVRFEPAATSLDGVSDKDVKAGVVIEFTLADHMGVRDTYRKVFAPEELPQAFDGMRTAMDEHAMNNGFASSRINFAGIILDGQMTPSDTLACYGWKSLLDADEQGLRNIVKTSDETRDERMEMVSQLAGHATFFPEIAPLEFTSDGSRFRITGENAPDFALAMQQPLARLKEMDRELSELVSKRFTDSTARTPITSKDPLIVLVNRLVNSRGSGFNAVQTLMAYGRSLGGNISAESFAYARDILRSQVERLDNDDIVDLAATIGVDESELREESIDRAVDNLLRWEYVQFANICLKERGLDSGLADEWVVDGRYVSVDRRIKDGSGNTVILPAIYNLEKGELDRSATAMCSTLTEQFTSFLSTCRPSVALQETIRHAIVYLGLDTDMVKAWLRNPQNAELEGIMNRLSGKDYDKLFATVDRIDERIGMEFEKRMLSRVRASFGDAGTAFLNYREERRAYDGSECFVRIAFDGEASNGTSDRHVIVTRDNARSVELSLLRRRDDERDPDLQSPHSVNVVKTAKEIAAHYKGQPYNIGEPEVERPVTFDSVRKQMETVIREAHDNPDTIYYLDIPTNRNAGKSHVDDCFVDGMFISGEFLQAAVDIISTYPDLVPNVVFPIAYQNSGILKDLALRKRVNDYVSLKGGTLSGDVFEAAGNTRSYNGAEGLPRLRRLILASFKEHEASPMSEARETELKKMLALEFSEKSYNVWYDRKNDSVNQREDKLKRVQVECLRRAEAMVRGEMPVNAAEFGNVFTTMLPDIDNDETYTAQLFVNENLKKTFGDDARLQPNITPVTALISPSSISTYKAMLQASGDDALAFSMGSSEYAGYHLFHVRTAAGELKPKIVNPALMETCETIEAQMALLDREALNAYYEIARRHPGIFPESDEVKTAIVDVLHRMFLKDDFMKESAIFWTLSNELSEDRDFVTEMQAHIHRMRPETLPANTRRIGGTLVYFKNAAPGSNAVMVFPTDTEGHHGSTVARQAVNDFGAMRRQTTENTAGDYLGLHGKSYSYATKDLAKAKELGIYNYLTTREQEKGAFPAVKAHWNDLEDALRAYYSDHSVTSLLEHNPFERSVSPRDIVEGIKGALLDAGNHPDMIYYHAEEHTRPVAGSFMTNSGYTEKEMAFLLYTAISEMGGVPANYAISASTFNAIKEFDRELGRELISGQVPDISMPAFDIVSEIAEDIAWLKSHRGADSVSLDFIRHQAIPSLNDIAAGDIVELPEIASGRIFYGKHDTLALKTVSKSLDGTLSITGVISNSGREVVISDPIVVRRLYRSLEEATGMDLIIDGRSYAASSLDDERLEEIRSRVGTEKSDVMAEEAAVYESDEQTVTWRNGKVKAIAFDSLDGATILFDGKGHPMHRGTLTNDPIIENGNIRAHYTIDENGFAGRVETLVYDIRAEKVVFRSDAKTVREDETRRAELGSVIILDKDSLQENASYSTNIFNIDGLPEDPALMQDYWKENYGKANEFSTRIGSMIAMVAQGEEVGITTGSPAQNPSAEYIAARVKEMATLSLTNDMNVHFDDEIIENTENAYVIRNAADPEHPRFVLSQSKTDGYNARTTENASKADVTCRFFFNENTAGEILTKKAALGKDFGKGRIFDARLTAESLIEPEKAGIAFARKFFNENKDMSGDVLLNIAGNSCMNMLEQMEKDKTLDRFLMTRSNNPASVTRPQRLAYIQSALNEMMFHFLSEVKRSVPHLSTISGGQTGADIAGTAASLRAAIPTEAHFPKNYLMQDPSGIRASLSGLDNVRKVLKPYVDGYVYKGKNSFLESDGLAGQSRKEWFAASVRFVGGKAGSKSDMQVAVSASDFVFKADAPKICVFGESLDIDLGGLSVDMAFERIKMLYGKKNEKAVQAYFSRIGNTEYAGMELEHIPPEEIPVEVAFGTDEETVLNNIYRPLLALCLRHNPECALKAIDDISRSYNRLDAMSKFNLQAIGFAREGRFTFTIDRTEVDVDVTGLTVKEVAKQVQDLYSDIHADTDGEPLPLDEALAGRIMDQVSEAAANDNIEAGSNLGKELKEARELNGKAKYLQLVDVDRENATLTVANALSSLLGMSQTWSEVQLNTSKLIAESDWLKPSAVFDRPVVEGKGRLIVVTVNKDMPRGALENMIPDGVGGIYNTLTKKPSSRTDLTFENIGALADRICTPAAGKHKYEQSKGLGKPDHKDNKKLENELPAAVALHDINERLAQGENIVVLVEQNDALLNSTIKQEIGTLYRWKESVNPVFIEFRKERQGFGSEETRDVLKVSTFNEAARELLARGGKNLVQGRCADLVFEKSKVTEKDMFTGKETTRTVITPIVVKNQETTTIQDITALSRKAKDRIKGQSGMIDLAKANYGRAPKFTNVENAHDIVALNSAVAGNSDFILDFGGRTKLNSTNVITLDNLDLSRMDDPDYAMSFAKRTLDIIASKTDVLSEKGRDGITIGIKDLLLGELDAGFRKTVVTENELSGESWYENSDLEKDGKVKKEQTPSDSEDVDMNEDSYSGREDVEVRRQQTETHDTLVEMTGENNAAASGIDVRSEKTMIEEDKETLVNAFCENFVSSLLMLSDDLSILEGNDRKRLNEEWDADLAANRMKISRIVTTGNSGLGIAMTNAANREGLDAPEVLNADNGACVIKVGDSEMKLQSGTYIDRVEMTADNCTHLKCNQFFMGETRTVNEIDTVNRALRISKATLGETDGEIAGHLTARQVIAMQYILDNEAILSICKRVAESGENVDTARLCALINEEAEKSPSYNNVLTMHRTMTIARDAAEKKFNEARRVADEYVRRDEVISKAYNSALNEGLTADEMITRVSAMLASENPPFFRNALSAEAKKNLSALYNKKTHRAKIDEGKDTGYRKALKRYLDAGSELEKTNRELAVFEKTNVIATEASMEDLLKNAEKTIRINAENGIYCTTITSNEYPDYMRGNVVLDTEAEFEKSDIQRDADGSYHATHRTFIGNSYAPSVLWYSGDGSIMNDPGVSLIADNSHNPESVKDIKEFAAELAKEGIVAHVALNGIYDDTKHGLRLSDKTEALMEFLDNGGKAVLYTEGEVTDEIKDIVDRNRANGGLVVSELLDRNKSLREDITERTEKIAACRDQAVALAGDMRGQSNLLVKCIMLAAIKYKLGKEGRLEKINDKDEEAIKANSETIQQLNAETVKKMSEQARELSSNYQAMLERNETAENPEDAPAEKPVITDPNTAIIQTIYHEGRYHFFVDEEQTVVRDFLRNTYKDCVIESPDHYRDVYNDLYYDRRRYLTIENGVQVVKTIDMFEGYTDHYAETQRPAPSEFRMYYRKGDGNGQTALFHETEVPADWIDPVDGHRFGDKSYNHEMGNIAISAFEKLQSDFLERIGASAPVHTMAYHLEIDRMAGRVGLYEGSRLLYELARNRKGDYRFRQVNASDTASRLVDTRQINHSLMVNPDGKIITDGRRQDMFNAIVNEFEKVLFSTEDSLEFGRMTRAERDDFEKQQEGEYARTLHGNNIDMVIGDMQRNTAFGNDTETVAISTINAYAHLKLNLRDIEKEISEVENRRMAQQDAITRLRDGLQAVSQAERDPKAIEALETEQEMMRSLDKSRVELEKRRQTVIGLIDRLVWNPTISTRVESGNGRRRLLFIGDQCACLDIKALRLSKDDKMMFATEIENAIREIQARKASNNTSFRQLSDMIATKREALEANIALIGNHRAMLLDAGSSDAAKKYAKDIMDKLTAENKILESDILELEAQLDKTVNSAVVSIADLDRMKTQLNGYVSSLNAKKQLLGDKSDPIGKKARDLKHVELAACMENIERLEKRMQELGSGPQTTVGINKMAELKNQLEKEQKKAADLESLLNDPNDPVGTEARKDAQTDIDGIMEKIKKLKADIAVMAEDDRRIESLLTPEPTKESEGAGAWECSAGDIFPKGGLAFAGGGLAGYESFHIAKDPAGLFHVVGKTGDGYTVLTEGYDNITPNGSIVQAIDGQKRINILRTADFKPLFDRPLDSIGSIHEGYCIVQRDGLYNMMEAKTGKLVIEGAWTSQISQMKNGWFIFAKTEDHFQGQNDGRVLNFMDRDGNVLSHEWTDAVVEMSKDGNKVFGYVKREDGFHMIDSMGREDAKACENRYLVPTVSCGKGIR